MNHASPPAAAAAAQGGQTTNNTHAATNEQHRHAEHTTARTDGGAAPSSTSPDSLHRSALSSNSREGASAANSNVSGCFKLFVGAIPETATEDDLRAIFEPFGEIVDLVILHDRYTRMPRGQTLHLRTAHAARRTSLHCAAENNR